MAVHNAEAYLHEAVESILSQTLSDLELVIVDDGSTDGSWSIIATAAADDRRIVARRRSSSGGASRALNEGLALGTGEYITRQDADDVSLPSRLAEQVAFLRAEPEASAVGSQAILIDPEGNRLSETNYPLAERDIQSTLLEFMCFVGPTVMARRTAFERAGLWFDDALSGSEDYDLCLRLSEVGALVNLGQPLYLYRKHGASVSNLQRHQQLARKARAVENAVRRRHGAQVPASAWKSVARDYLRAAVVAHAVNETGAAQTWIGRALECYPEIFADSTLVDQVVRRYLRIMPEESRLSLAQTLFVEVFPRTRDLRTVQRRIVAELHMSMLFASRADSRMLPGHLWSALRSNPAWLLNREVIALLMKRAIGRGRSTDPGLPS